MNGSLETVPLKRCISRASFAFTDPLLRSPIGRNPWVSLDVYIMCGLDGGSVEAEEAPEMHIFEGTVSILPFIVWAISAYSSRIAWSMHRNTSRFALTTACFIRVILPSRSSSGYAIAHKLISTTMSQIEVVVMGEGLIRLGSLEYQ